MTTPQEKPTNLLWKVLLPIIAILALITGGLYWVKSQVQPGGGAPQSTAAKSSNLPDFELREFGGKTKKVSELKAKVILINFWATWCEACMVEMPSIVALRKNYLSKGLDVVAINVDENPETVLPKTLPKLGIDFPVYVDPEGKIADLLDLRAIPLTVIIDSERKILFSQNGEYDWNSAEFRARVDGWLAK